MIVTTRARWLLILSITWALVGIFTGRPFVTQLAIASLLWLGCEWLSFAMRVEFGLRRMRVSRRIVHQPGKQRILWLSRPTKIETDIFLPKSYGLLPAYLDIRDLLPTPATLLSGTSHWQGTIGTDWRERMSPLRCSYQIQPDSIGELKFAGLRILLSDLHGFFQYEDFLPHAETYRVFPVGPPLGTPMSVRKRNNRQFLPGIHSMACPGVGTDLLDFRDYVVGDPLRSIAWKVSARRDQLTVKQFESEVPVRCHFLVDVGLQARWGYPGPCQAVPLANLAASLARTYSADRDPVAIHLFDEASVTMARPTSYRREIIGMIEKTTAALARPLPTVDLPFESFEAIAWDTLRVRYPRLLHATASTWSTRWLPLRLNTRRRWQMAAVLTCHFQLPPHYVGILSRSNRQFSTWLQKFLMQMQVPLGRPRDGTSGKRLHDDRAKIQQVANILTTLTARAKDNELFVLLVNLTADQYDLNPLFRAVQVARARHHRVCIICGVPVKPAEPIWERLSVLTADQVLEEFASEQESRHVRDLQQSFARLRVPLHPCGDVGTQQMLLQELELIRTGRLAKR